MRNTITVERAKKKWTQAELANRVGVSRQAINAVETGKFVPSTVLALKIAREFGAPVEEVFILEQDD
ncbi:MAG: helix-turn-helix transcriptional regulator [Flavobacteriales bacterium]|nr:helix-turn-helix transcriptional regulator [Flavobacteriales bacterium]